MHLSGLFTALLLAGASVAHSWDAVFDTDSGAVQSHLRQRSSMIALEKRDRQDYAFKQNLSSVAKEAEKIVQKIRMEEIDNFWRVYSTPSHPEDERFAGEMFPLARKYIADTKLWKIIRRMPKGALLHAHLTAMLPYGILLETIINTEGMTFSASDNLGTAATREKAKLVFGHQNTSIPAGPSISSNQYKPDTPVPIKDAIKEFPGGKGAFTKYVMSKLVVEPKESTQHELGVDEIWRLFQGLFDPAGTMLTYEPIVRKFYERLFEQLVDDGINWVEIRAGGSSGKLVHTGQENADPSLDFWWQVMEDEVSKFKKTEKGSKFWGTRVIWSDSRGKSKESLVKSMKIALDRKLKFPELFSGYDVVGQEDLGRSLVEMAPELLWFQDQAANLNVTVPFFFHAGETLGDGNATDSNLFDAILLGTRRIGHGFSIYKHPQLIDEVIDNNIMVEVCPISNEVLRLATDILHHPLPAMVAHGVPTAISNDDPAMLGQNAAGLSYDFYQVIQGFDNIGLAGLGALAQNSLRWSNFEDQADKDWIRDIELGENGSGIKAQRMQEWNEQWESFCQWVVKEYGSTKV